MVFQDDTGAAPIKISRSAGVATIMLDRPTKMNAVTQAMWRDLADFVAGLCADETVRVILLCGSGTNFCAGADIGEFEQVRRDAATAREYEAANAAAFAAFRNASVPTIAAISGVCFGGGFGLAAACDLRIASADARFSVPAARLGLAYPVEAMSDIVHAAGPQMARYLTYSASAIDATTAQAAGFLLEIVEAEALMEKANTMAHSIAANAPLSIKASKAAIHAVLTGDRGDVETARQLGEQTFDSRDYGEGRAAFRERRKPEFSGK